MEDEKYRQMHDISYTRHVPDYFLKISVLTRVYIYIYRNKRYLM